MSNFFRNRIAVGSINQIWQSWWWFTGSYMWKWFIQTSSFVVYRGNQVTQTASQAWCKVCVDYTNMMYFFWLFTWPSATWNWFCVATVLWLNKTTWILTDYWRNWYFWPWAWGLVWWFLWWITTLTSVYSNGSILQINVNNNVDWNKYNIFTYSTWAWTSASNSWATWTSTLWSVYSTNTISYSWKIYWSNNTITQWSINPWLVDFVIPYIDIS